jgi:DNA topoisomerase-3
MENIRVEKEDGSFDYGIADPIQVSYWSAQTKKIQLGELTVDEVMDRFEKYLNKKISEVKSSGDPIKRSRAEQAAMGLPACPLCGGKVASGKFGYYCSTYKESGCKLSIPNEMAGKKLTDNQKKGLLEGKKVHAKGFTSKAGKQFDADIVLNKSTGKVEFDFSSSQKSFPKKK